MCRTAAAAICQDFSANGFSTIRSPMPRVFLLTRVEPSIQSLRKNQLFPNPTHTHTLARTRVHKRCDLCDQDIFMTILLRFNVCMSENVNRASYTGTYTRRFLPLKIPLVSSRSIAHASRGVLPGNEASTFTSHSACTCFQLS